MLIPFRGFLNKWGELLIYSTYIILLTLSKMVSQQLSEVFTGQYNPTNYYNQHFMLNLYIFLWLPSSIVDYVNENKRLKISEEKQ